jgi:hypothetical protein
MHRRGPSGSVQRSRSYAQVTDCPTPGADCPEARRGGATSAPRPQTVRKHAEEELLLRLGRGPSARPQRTTTMRFVPVFGTQIGANKSI